MRRYLLLLLMLPHFLFAQGARYDNTNVTSATNTPFGAQSTLYTLPFSKVTVCAYPDDGSTPCTNTVPIFSDSALSQPLANPLKADVHGRFGFWLPPGTYSYSVATATGTFTGTYQFTLGSQTGVSNTINVTNGYTGDLGQQVNAAIAANGCATYNIPPGTYTFTHPIKIPHCVSVFGNGEATKLLWTGTGAAVILSNVTDPGQYVQGYFGNLSITGTSTTGQIGVYQGGDPSCTGACTANPSTNIGYNYVVRDLIEYNMDNGMQWGNEAFNIQWTNVLLQNNKSYGWYYPATALGGGQVSHFYHSSMSGNALGAFFIAQPPQVTFSMYGMDIEYNGSQTAPGVTAMQGGTYTCTDCHIESAFGPFVSMGVNNQTVKFVGGVWVLTSGTTTDPYLVSVNGGKSSYSMDGTLLYVLHPVTNLVQETAASPTVTLDVKNLGLYDPSYNLKAVTNKTGPGVSWCLPYNNTTGTTAGTCYNGNNQSGAITTQASSLSAATFPSNAAVMTWNGDAASGGVDYYDTYSSTNAALYAFRFTANEAGTYKPLFSVFRDGWVSGAGYKVNGVNGYTGEQIAGTCVFDMNGGIVTSVTGCSPTAVTSVNGLSSGVTVAGGTGITVTPNGQTLTISQAAGGGGAGVSSINSTTGAFTFTGAGVGCTGTTCTFSGGGTGTTGPAYHLPGFVSGTGTTLSLGALNIFTDYSGNELHVPTNLTAGTLAVDQTNCSVGGTSINGNVCIIENTNQTANGGITSSLFQVTGPGRYVGQVNGAIHNYGWSHAQAHATTATFYSRGLHFMEGDNGQGMNCQSVGDCIYSYKYLNYIGGFFAPADEAVKNQAFINKEYAGFYKGTVNTITDNTAPGGTYPTGAHKVTMVLNGTTAGGGTNQIGDGTALMGDPTVTGTTSCQFNGAPTLWTGSSVNIGSVPITGCTGAAVPTITAWGTATVGTDGNMIGDTVANGNNTNNIPAPQSFVITLGTGSGAFTVPDGTNTWSNFVCLRGNSVENDRITAYNATTNTMTANVRYPEGSSVAVFQGPACAPYQAISIDVDLANSPQASSYTALGTVDGGAHLLYADYGLMLRANDTPETTTSTFKLVPKSEIVANTAPNVFSGNPQLQIEDNAAATKFTANAAVWNPHPVNNPDEVFSAYDYTAQYNNSGYASGLFVSGASGPRVTGGYQVNNFVNGNGTGMYKYFGGWATAPSRLSSAGVFSSIVTNDRMPWDSVIKMGDWNTGQTITKLFDSPNAWIYMRKDAPNTGQLEWDFSRDGADSVRASFFTFPKVNPASPGTAMHLGVCTNGVGACFGTYANSTGNVTNDLAVKVGAIYATDFLGPLTSPPVGTTCTTGSWEFAQDGKGSFCKAGVWEVVFTAP